MTTMMEAKGNVVARHNLRGLWANEHGFENVNSYHDQAVTGKMLSGELISPAGSEDTKFEALLHKTHPWLGTMWYLEHEKVPDEGDLARLKNYLGE